MQVSEAPERIWIDENGGNWSPVDGGTQDLEYIRSDLSMQWNDNMDEAPRDGTEILLHYSNFLGAKDLVVSGHWYGHGDEINDTWEHSLGYGDPTHWMPPPEPPK